MIRTEKTEKKKQKCSVRKYRNCRRGGLGGKETCSTPWKETAPCTPMEKVVPHHERGIRRQVALPDGRKLALSRVGELVVALETEMVMPKGR